jgi:branched-chain amino acid transport system permease protein
LKSVRQHLWWIILAGFLLLFPLVYSSPSYLNNATEILINALFAVSLNLLVGYTGLLSLGHCAFFAVGSYTTGLLLREASTSIPLALLGGGLLAAMVAVAMGYLCTRLTKFYFAFLTLALSQIVYVVIVKWVSLTGGDQGLIGGIPHPAIHFLGLTLDISSRLNFYYFTVLLVCGSFILCKVIVDSPFGWLLRCIRENQLRTGFIGVNVRRYQLGIFTIAGIFGAISGGLAALNINGCYAEHAYWLKGADPVFMILIGGIKTFVGPIVGAAVLVCLNSFIGAYTRYSALILGSILIFLVAFARMGIVDFLVLQWESLRKLWEKKSPPTLARDVSE